MRELVARSDDGAVPHHDAAEGHARGDLRPELVRSLRKQPPRADDGATYHQTIHLETGPVVCPIYDRGKLGDGATIEGPAILMQLDATTLVLPGQRGTVDRCGNLLITEI